MKLHEFISFYESIVPLELQEAWDHSGIQLGDPEDSISKILLALDIDNDCISYAVQGGYNLIVTHHPLFFHPLTQITTSTIRQRQVRQLIQHNIHVYSSHTNLDCVQGGVNDVLVKKLELKNTEILSVNEDFPQYGLGRVGWTTCHHAQEFADRIKKNLHLDYILYYGSLNRPLQKVAVIGGSGASLIEKVISIQCDALVTSDIKYHEADFALDNELLLFDIGHYESEKWVLESLKELFTSLRIPVEIFYRQRSTRNIY